MRDARHRGEHDLFGGVVPHPFVATKSISHPLVDAERRAPDGWSVAFAREVRAACWTDSPPSASKMHARRVCASSQGPVRVKRALGIGGSGQVVVAIGTRSSARSPISTQTSFAIRHRARTEPHGRDDLQHRPGARGRSRGELLRHAAADREQPRRDRLRRIDSARCARRLRRAARDRASTAGPARHCRTGTKSTTTRRSDASPASFASRRNYDVARGRRCRGRASLRRARAVVARRRRKRRRSRPRCSRSGTTLRCRRAGVVHGTVRRRRAAAGGCDRVFHAAPTSAPAV